MRIRHRHRIGECKRLSVGYEIRQVNRKVGKFPIDRPAAGPRAVARDKGGEGFCECRHGGGRKLIKRRFIKCRDAGSGQRRIRQRRSNRVGIGQVDIGKCQRSRRGCVSDGLQISAGGEFASRIRDGFRSGGNDRNVIGAGDRYCKRKGGRLIVPCKVVLDNHVVGQRQRLAGAEEIESIVRDTVGPGRRTVVIVAGG